MKRFTFLKFAIIVVLVFGGMFSLSPVHGARAATIMVDSAADNLTAGDTLCTLREAIRNANLPLGGDLTSGDCETADSGLDTIVFASSLDTTPITLSITGSGEDAAAQGDLDITGSVTITGNGAGKTIIDANGIDRVFQLFSGITVTLNNLTIKGGNRPVSGLPQTGYGGGILSEATLILNGVRVTGNQAGLRAGGIYDGYNSSGSLTLNNSTVDNNSSVTSGGGIFVAASMTATNSTISGNSSDDNGGGLVVYGGSATLTHTTVVNNIANADNATDGDGGGIAQLSGPISIQNSLVADNSVFAGGGGTGPDCTGTITSLDYNLVEQGTVGCTVSGGSNDILNPTAFTMPPLADNGGSAPTHAIPFDSVAIDHIPNGTNGCGSTYTTDQRNRTRPVEGDGTGALPACDAGAYEAGEMQCSVSDGNDYTFTTQSNVLIHVTNTNSSLGCLYVDEKPANHPNATGTTGGTGTKTGKYWTIEGLQSDGVTPATGYSVNLTLPHNVSPDTNAFVCKYPGGLGGNGWDCARTSSTTSTVERDGISSLSEWAVGNNVSPTALTLQTLTARSVTLPITIATLGFLSVALLLLLWRKKNHIPQT